MPSFILLYLDAIHYKVYTVSEMVCVDYQAQDLDLLGRQGQILMTLIVVRLMFTVDPWSEHPGLWTR